MKKLFRQFNAILLPQQKRGIFRLFLGSLLTALIDTLVVALMMPFMTAIVNPVSIQQNQFWSFIGGWFGGSTPYELLVIQSFLFIAIYLLRGAYKTWFNFKQARMIAAYRTDISGRLFTFVMDKPYAYHVKHDIAQSQRLVITDVNSCFTLLNQIILAGASLLVSIGIFLVLFSLDTGFTVTLLVLAMVFVLLIKRYLNRAIQRCADYNFKASSQMMKWVNQSIGGLKSILIKKKQKYFVDKYVASAKESSVANSSFTAIDSLPKVLIDTMCMVGVFAVVAVQLLTTKELGNTLPMFATFAMAALRLIPVVGQITTTINSIGFYEPCMNAISDMLLSQDINLGEIQCSTVERHAEMDQSTQLKTTLTDGIQIEHIAFRFEDAEEDLYQDLSLFIPAKKSVAFVGTTGSGKTTLADIILGLQKPGQGHVYVDGIDIQKHSDWWASMVGYIPQFIYLCDDTIRANVAFGFDNNEIDDDQVWNCLERAQMKSFVAGLPQGIETVSGENGIRLSGGQRQRIGIARALYTKPQFLLMDEATSALDGETEKAIVDSINSLSGDLTLLIIAHRVSTIKNCDLVYRIENGQAKIERQMRPQETME